MRIPETPEDVAELDLMKRLKSYADGAATWHESGEALGKREREACALLHANLIVFVERCIHPILDRITAREMQTFTMHDRNHALKVAHLMWHITKPSRREKLSPGEIGLLVSAAHLHDLGMAINDEERKARLSEKSDLWERVDPDSSYFKALESLWELSSKPGVSPAVQSEAIFQAEQAQEALLCVDCRDRHATRERYDELLTWFASQHDEDPDAIPNIYSVLSFDGDSFHGKLVDICISHNEDAHVLLDRDPSNFDQLRFPQKYPIGCCIADCRFIGAALRLADILDFDRERTPAVLYHYLLPRSDNPADNVSVREWSKNLAISNWEIEDRKIIFRGRSPSALVHHAIVQFCDSIEDEIARTFSVFNVDEWPFDLSPKVEAALEAIGYRYVPYQFTLDEDRVYSLLIGRNIYRDRRDAVRELIQNAVDACKLRDALMVCHDPSIRPAEAGRIIVRYEDAGTRSPAPVRSVIDSGVGMDRYIIENYFLKVGRSYYSSHEFLKTRGLLNHHRANFNPVSEFGIGFMSVFMLGDRVEVETAPWSSMRQDDLHRILRIDGLGRLIEVREQKNSGAHRFHGTRVSVQLNSRDAAEGALNWANIQTYLSAVCVNLDYPLSLEHITADGKIETQLLPAGLSVPVPEHLKESAMRVQVDDATYGLKGEIVIFREPAARKAQSALAAEEPIVSDGEGPIVRRSFFETGTLIRGGFALGHIPGLPRSYPIPADGRIEVQHDREHKNALPVTDLSRSRFVNSGDIGGTIFKLWFGALLNSIEEVEARPIGSPDIGEKYVRNALWLQEYSAFQLYRLAKASWQCKWKDPSAAKSLIERWEEGSQESLWVGSHLLSSSDLHWIVMELIMPKVTRLVVVGDGNFSLVTPEYGWRSRLREWNSFIEEDLSWGLFAEYRSPIENLLLRASTRCFLNKRFEDRFEHFSVEEQRAVPPMIEALIEARENKRQAEVAQTDLPLLDKLLAAAGELEVAKYGRKYKLAELTRQTKRRV